MLHSAFEKFIFDESVARAPKRLHIFGKDNPGIEIPLISLDFQAIYDMKGKISSHSYTIFLHTYLITNIDIN